jgi:hypothetical protein
LVRHAIICIERASGAGGVGSKEGWTMNSQEAIKRKLLDRNGPTPEEARLLSESDKRFYRCATIMRLCREYYRKHGYLTSIAIDELIVAYFKIRDEMGDVFDRQECEQSIRDGIQRSRMNMPPRYARGA